MSAESETKSWSNSEFKNVCQEAVHRRVEGRTETDRAVEGEIRNYNTLDAGAQRGKNRLWGGIPDRGRGRDKAIAGTKGTSRAKGNSDRRRQKLNRPASPPRTERERKGVEGKP